MYCMIHIQNPAYYCKSRHLGILWHILCAFSEPCHIQNLVYINLVYLKPNIYLELCQGIFWHILNILRTLPYPEFCHIKDPRHIQNLVYLGTFRHIQTYLMMVIISLKFMNHGIQRIQRPAAANEKRQSNEHARFLYRQIM